MDSRLPHHNVHHTHFYFDLLSQLGDGGVGGSCRCAEIVYKCWLMEMCSVNILLCTVAEKLGTKLLQVVKQ